MSERSGIGSIPVPPGFKHMRLLAAGRPQHCGDYFSVRHPKMNCAKRAKIFAPFAALRGFDFELWKKDLQYEARRERTEEQVRELNDTLRDLHARTPNRHAVLRDPVSVTAEYYVPCGDRQRDGWQDLGRYETACGIVQYADPVTQTLRIGDTVLCFEDLYRITISPCAEKLL